MNRATKTLIFSLFLLLTGCSTLKANTFANDDGAIRGYDPIAYHTENKPVRGKPEHTFEYNGASWFFASEENLELFRNNPDRYAPEYGGYCAYGMSKGFVVSTDPHAWTIVDDKLYLNYSKGVRETWLRDTGTFIERADQHWQDKRSL